MAFFPHIILSNAIREVLVAYSSDKTLRQTSFLSSLPQKKKSQGQEKSCVGASLWWVLLFLFLSSVCVLIRLSVHVTYLVLSKYALGVTF